MEEMGRVLDSGRRLWKQSKRPGVWVWLMVDGGFNFQALEIAKKKEEKREREVARIKE